MMQEQDLNLVKRSVSGLLSNVSKYENVLYPVCSSIMNDKNWSNGG